MPKRVDRIVLQYALRHPACTLKPITRAVVHALLTWAGPDGADMYPSGELVAVAAGVNRETARKALAEAVDKGFLIRSMQGRAGPGVTYTYAASVPDDWPWLTIKALREWEKDPAYRSERTRRGRTSPRRRQGHVPNESGDNSNAGRLSGSLVEASYVPASTRACPQNDGVDVPASTGICPRNRVADVPAAVSPIKSSISSATKSHTSSLTRKCEENERDEIANRIERLFVEQHLTGRPLDERSDEAVTFLTMKSKRTEPEIRAGLQMLINSGRLPLKATHGHKA